MPSLTATQTSTPSPATATPTSSPTALPPSATPGPVICSPLEGVKIPDLAAVIVNPFAPPRQGSDDPHQGVDLADVDAVYQMALEGRVVRAVTTGVIAGVVTDRFPYGHAILVEIPFDQVSPEGLAALQIPTPAPTREGHPALTCPKVENPPNWDAAQRSLYLLYAHLQMPPTFEIGDPIVCGQSLNTIGNSGNSLNPHLHLELRVGPAGASFESMAHYTGSASPEEMQNYCLWRVSEAFQLLDPMKLFEVR